MESYCDYRMDMRVLSAIGLKQDNLTTYNDASDVSHSYGRRVHFALSGDIHYTINDLVYKQNSFEV